MCCVVLCRVAKSNPEYRVAHSRAMTKSAHCSSSTHPLSPSLSSFCDDSQESHIGKAADGPATLVRYHPLLSSATSSYYYNRLKEARNGASQTSSIGYRLSQYFFVAATYFSILVLTSFAIACLFCLFLAIRFIDDVMKSFVPGRIWSAVRGRVLAIDWPGALTRWSSHLARLADWEKTRRTSLNPAFSERFANIDGDGLHAFLFSFTGLLDGLRANNSSRQWRWHPRQQ
ncbi:hypothetical protein BX666DRAFT_46260 [Dichotomocladium elegans]|nr:hypothetical protein BX666DRAFT_46260 [Dichotomocladium elegans]